MPRLFKQSNPTEIIRQYTNPISGMRIVTYKVDGKPYPYETALQSKYLYQNQLRPIALYHDEEKSILGHYGHIEVQTGYKASVIMAHVKDAVNITHSDVLAAFAVQVKDESAENSI
jgi:hypothetical protein